MGIYVISFEMIGYMLWKNNLKLYAKKINYLEVIMTQN